MSRRPCVLVHGGWCGGWHWESVAGALRDRGHRVETPTLPGMAERAHEARPDTGLHAHVADITALIERKNLRDVVLVGHSYGGAVVTGVAHSHIRNRIAELLVLDGFVPENGESLTDIMGKDFLAASQTAAEAAGTPYLIPPMFSVEAVTGWTGERAAALAARQCSQPIATATDVMDAPGTPTARRSFIFCNKPPLGLFDRYAQAARTSESWLYFELASPHDAVHVMPAAVAGIVESLTTP